MGSGYTIPELNELRDRLRDKWRPYDKRRSPAWLQGWRAEPGDVPDVVIEPSASVIVEVKCYEITPCPASKFLAEFTCRFPRVVRFRYSDKEWYEAESIDHIRQLAAQDRVRGRKMEEKAAVSAVGPGRQPFSEEAFSPPHSPASDVDEEEGGTSQLEGQWGLAGQLTASQDGSVDGGKRGGRKRIKGQTMAGALSDEPNTVADNKGDMVGQKRAAAAGGILPLFQPASGLSAVERRSSLFAGLSVVVMVQPECQPSKAELERLVVQHGGEVRQNPPARPVKSAATPSVRCVLLSDGESSYKLQAHQRSGRFDIVHFSWLTHCIERGRMVRYKQDHIISTTTATNTERSRQVDQFGDDYTDDLHSTHDTSTLMHTVRQARRLKQETAQSGVNKDGTEYRGGCLTTAPIKQPPPSSPLCPASVPPPAATSSHSCWSLLSQVDERIAAMRRRVFDGVHALILTDEQSVSAEVEGQSVEAAIIHCALVLNGAEVSGPVSVTSTQHVRGAPLTHCIVLSISEADTRRDEEQGQAHRVTLAWVIDSLRSGHRQNETSYSPLSINAH